MATVTVNLEGQDDDFTVEVPAFGIFHNGETKEVNETQLALYESMGFVFPESCSLVITVPQNPGQPEEAAPETAAADLDDFDTHVGGDE